MMTTAEQRAELRRLRDEWCDSWQVCAGGLLDAKANYRDAMLRHGNALLADAERGAKLEELVCVLMGSRHEQLVFLESMGAGPAQPMTLTDRELMWACKDVFTLAALDAARKGVTQ